MKDFFLNFTRIIEHNPKIYWSIIVGIVLCLVLFIVEVIQIQNLIAQLNTHDQVILKNAIEPLTQKYKWARVLIIIMAVFIANYEYLKTKKKLGLTQSK
ncbi:hypothetical protein B9T31_06430 [Acinetobacter sp. ANC 4558]|uniref:hypothetical protein n=1 Tax=Acinetobacter sp. ANC 4558 TaxID=1977876 RepID=UPI000A338C19|nr:hypothetical protein [Acinetobacter sp. ANC 4558]OTG86638.1 hypothetical protein B9T31_06430 [Acinetobacter sp. ANC 4558]